MKRKRIIKIASLGLAASFLAVGLTACSNHNSSNSQTTSSKTANKQTKSAKKASSSTSTTTDTQNKTAKIKLSQADALNIFNQKFHNSKIKSIDLEEKMGHYVYEIDGFDTTKEHEMTINAENGKITHQSSEHLDADDRHEQGLDLTKVISRKKASEIAKKHTNATPIAWKLEVDDGRSLWEVKTLKGSDHGEIKIDALSQKVISEGHDVNLDD